MQRVEDLYKPYKKKRATRASKARDAGLEPLALLLIAQATTHETRARWRRRTRRPTAPTTRPRPCCRAPATSWPKPSPTTPSTSRRCARSPAGTAVIEVAAVDANEKTVYDAYYGSSEQLARIPNHRILAINRGEKEGKLQGARAHGRGRGRRAAGKAL